MAVGVALHVCFELASRWVSIHQGNPQDAAFKVEIILFFLYILSKTLPVFPSSLPAVGTVLAFKLQSVGTKVDQQTDLYLRCGQVVDQLNFVGLDQELNCLVLDQHPAFDQHIGRKSPTLIPSYHTGMRRLHSRANPSLRNSCSKDFP
jgi:hypothetical protein